MKQRGVIIHAVRNRGYRLAVPTAPLDAQRIRDGMNIPTRTRLRQLEVAWQLESTNSTLFARTDLPAGHCDVLLAEVQTAGRGRRGRSWLATPGGALCLSMGWTFAQLPRDMGSLGLAVGVCALRALREHLPEPEPTRTPLQLKWPNDLQSDARKLGGILIDMRAEARWSRLRGHRLGPQYRDRCGRHERRSMPPAPIRATLGPWGVSPLQRNQVVTSLIQCLVRGLIVFEHEGFEAVPGRVAAGRRAARPRRECRDGAGDGPAASHEASTRMVPCLSRPQGVGPLCLRRCQRESRSIMKSSP